MNMDYRVKQLMRGKLVPAVLSIVLGIVIIIARRAAVDVLVKVIGGLVIAAGIGFFVIYLTREEKTSGNLKMVIMCSLVMILAGVLLFVFAPNIVDIFPVSERERHLSAANRITVLRKDIPERGFKIFLCLR